MATTTETDKQASKEVHKPFYKDPGWLSLIATGIYTIAGIGFLVLSGCFGFYINARDKLKEFDSMVAAQSQQASAIQAFDQRLRVLEGTKSSSMTAEERKQLREADASLRSLRGQIAGLELNERKLNEQFEALKDAVRALAK